MKPLFPTIHGDFTHEQKRNIRRRVLGGLAMRDKTLAGLAEVLSLSPGEMMGVLTGAAGMSWIDKDAEGQPLLILTAKYLLVPTDALLPWGDPGPLLNPVLPQVPVGSPANLWKRPVKRR